MPPELTQALILLALLQIKHMFADFYLQTPNMLRDRGLYLHSGRAQHCAVHSVGSLVAMLLVGVGFGVALVICVIEWLVHFHIDYGKGRWSNRMEHGPTDASYWRAFGVDQALHQLSYLVLVWAAIVWA